MRGKQIELKQLSDIVTARQACREMARKLGFGSADQTRLATAVSELARNALQHAGQGVCGVTNESDNKTAVIRVVVEDHGPGIADVGKALKPGFTTTGGLGMGLPGAKRLAHDFAIASQQGQTTVQLKLVKKKT